MGSSTGWECIEALFIGPIRGQLGVVYQVYKASVKAPLKPSSCNGPRGSKP